VLAAAVTASTQTDHAGGSVPAPAAITRSQDPLYDPVSTPYASVGVPGPGPSRRPGRRPPPSHRLRGPHRRLSHPQHPCPYVLQYTMTRRQRTGRKREESVKASGDWLTAPCLPETHAPSGASGSSLDNGGVRKEAYPGLVPPNQPARQRSPSPSLSRPRVFRPAREGVLWQSPPGGESAPY
jgi:hypothetical protein